MNKKMFAASVAVLFLVAGCCQSTNESKCETSCKSSCQSANGGCSAKENLDSLKLVMLISIKTKPEGVAGFIKAINKCAAETMKEPGCLDYTIYQSPNDPTQFMLTEAWENKAYHRAHMDTPHLKVYFEEIKDLVDNQNNPRPSATYRICPEVQN